MSESLFNKIGKLNQLLGRQSWIAKPIYYLIDRAVPTESRDDLA